MKHVTIWVLFAALTIAVPALASDPAGNIIQCQGTVMVFRNGAVQGERASNGMALYIGDQARSLTESEARVHLVDGSRILLSEKSTLVLEGFDTIGVENGRVLFDIKKRGALQGMRVKTATALIGVKGTRFAVDRDSKDVAIHLERGRLQVDAVGEVFRRQKQGLKEEYEATLEEMRGTYEKNRAQLQAQFDEGKKQLAEGDFEAFQSFDMEAGQSFLISDRLVKPIALPEDLAEQLKKMDDF